MGDRLHKELSTGRVEPRLKPLAVAFCAVLVPLSVQAAGEEAKAQTLEQVVITADVLDPDDSRPRTVSTATKTAMDPKDVPQSINTLEMSKSKVYGLNDLSVLLDGTPGIDTEYDMRGDGINIRGFAASSNDIYRDGVRATGQIRRSTANVERIEILKGPASVLYGRGQGGGVVNLISKQASPDAVSSVNLRAGSFGNRGATIDLNHVVNPNVVVRLTADAENADSFRDGIKNRNRMVSPSILYDNHDNFSWLLQYTYDKVWRRPDRAPAYDTLPDGVSRETAYAHTDDYVEDEMEMFRSVMDYRFNDAWAVKWTAAVHEANQSFDHLYGGAYCQPDGTLKSNGNACANPGLMTFTRAWQDTSNRTLSNNVDFTGKFDTGPVSHDVLIGFELSRENRSPDLSTSQASSDPSLAYPYAVDPFNPIWVAPKTPRGEAKTSNRHKAESQAIYLQDLIGLSEKWKVLVGMRFDRFEFGSHNRITNQKRSYKGTTVSPRLGLVWQPVKEHSLYASYSKNFAPYGGRGLMSVAVAENAVYDEKPQYSNQYEVGVKSDWAGGRLSTQVAVYELELYNIRYRPDPTNDPYTWAVRGGQRSRGLELSMAGQVRPNWYVRAGLGFQQAKVSEDKVSPATEGNRLPDIASRTGNLFVRYAPPGNWYGELGVTYRGDSYNDTANTSKRAGYTRWDASVGWRLMPWTITLAVTNLTDTEYLRSTSMPGAPRTALLSASYVF